MRDQLYAKLQEQNAELEEKRERLSKAKRCHQNRLELEKAEKEFGVPIENLEELKEIAQDRYK